jgi:hypothetical protein
LSMFVCCCMIIGEVRIRYILVTGSPLPEFPNSTMSSKKLSYCSRLRKRDCNNYSSTLTTQGSRFGLRTPKPVVTMSGQFVSHYYSEALWYRLWNVFCWAVYFCNRMLNGIFSDAGMPSNLPWMITVYYFFTT